MISEPNHFDCFKGAVLRWAPGTRARSTSDGTLVIENRMRRLHLPPLSPEISSFLGNLGLERGLEMRDVEASSARRVKAPLNQLFQAGVISFSLLGGRIQLTPIQSRISFELQESVEDHDLIISRFAYVRRVGERFQLDCPLSPLRAVIDSGETLGRILSPSSDPDIRHVRQILFATKLMTCQQTQQSHDVIEGAEDRNEDLQKWEFHDLLFHNLSRIGRHDQNVGRHFPFLGRLDPLPPQKQSMSERTIPLSEPAKSETAERPAKTFFEVSEERRSVRHYGRPLEIGQLSEFLYRACRVQSEVPFLPEKHAYQETRRPYPGGGGCHELEIYLVVNTCSGLDAGLYHYDPFSHALEMLPDNPAARFQLLRDAELASGSGQRPPVLFVITARFGRMTWKYRSMAYAAILKNVGALYQQMYLTATALGLAPCALGAGNVEASAALTQEPFWKESSVGEFMLGTRPDRAGDDSRSETT